MKPIRILRNALTYTCYSFTGVMLVVCLLTGERMPVGRLTLNEAVPTMFLMSVCPAAIVAVLEQLRPRGRLWQLGTEVVLSVAADMLIAVLRGWLTVGVAHVALMAGIVLAAHLFVWALCTVQGWLDARALNASWSQVLRRRKGKENEK